MQPLRRLNFRHLRYFMTVASEGSVTTAAKRLHVAPQTVSAQVLALEQAFGRPLFERAGKRMTLNAEGEAALEYARTIFSLGEELGNLLAGVGEPQRQRLRIGLTDSIPKMLALKALDPVMADDTAGIELSCVEGRLTELLGRALDHQLDAVLADTPPPVSLAGSLRVRELGRCGLSFLAGAALSREYRGSFPQRLHRMPFLTWASDSPLSLAMQQWFTRHRLEPRIVGRFDDSALMKAFAGRGLGAVAVPTLIEDEVCRQFGLKRLGRSEDVKYPIYLMSPTRLRRHALVDRIEAASLSAE